MSTFDCVNMLEKNSIAQYEIFFVLLCPPPFSLTPHPARVLGAFNFC